MANIIVLGAGLVGGVMATDLSKQHQVTSVDISQKNLDKLNGIKWDKEIETPVSGLFEYYDGDGNWVASIDFGDGTCDEWATKTWDVNLFPDYPSGSENFSVFDYYKDKKDK